MPAFITSGGAIDLALVIVVLEFIVLLALRTGRKKILAAPETFAHLGAAAALLAAADLLLRRSAWQYPALALSAALIAHVVALRLRWRDAVNVNSATV